MMAEFRSASIGSLRQPETIAEFLKDSVESRVLLCRRQPNDSANLEQGFEPSCANSS